MSDIRRSSMVIKNTQQNNRYGDYKNSDRGLFQPSGSNFDLIYPEVGVTLIEGNKKKGGDRDFFRKYHKYSKNDYLNMLKDSINQNISILETSQKIQKNIKTEQSNASLPSLKTKENVTIQKFNFHNNSNDTYIKEEIPSKSLNLMESMKISKKLTSSLKNTLDNLDLIAEYDEKFYEEKKNIKNNGGNILSNLKLHKKEGQSLKEDKSLEDINKFNFSLIHNSSWGASYSNENLKRNSEIIRRHKPNIKELSKEMGISIVNTKLPRSRIFHKAENKI